MSDVTIPTDVAKRIAAWLRGEGVIKPTPEESAWADLLDPPAPTLREQAYDALSKQYPDAFAPMLLASADAVLAVVADWLAAQPLNTLNPGRIQRDADVALIRGGGTR